MTTCKHCGHDKSEHGYFGVGGGKVVIGCISPNCKCRIFEPKEGEG